MKNNQIGILARMLCTVMCLLMLMSCLVLSTAAEEAPGFDAFGEDPMANQTAFRMPKIAETIWEVDFANISSVPKTVVSEKYGTATVSTGGKLEVGKGITSATKFSFSMEEPTGSPLYGNSVVNNYDGFLVYSAVVNFTSLPVIASESYKSPLSLMKWQRYKLVEKNGAVTKSTVDYGRLVCIDENGYLYNDARERVATDVRIPTGEDTTLSVVMDTRSGACQYYFFVNGIFAFTDTLAIRDFDVAALHMFDTQRSYKAHLKKVSLQTADPSYEVKSFHTADWAAVQTTEIANNTYDLRFLSLLDSLEYKNVGYEVTAAYRTTPAGEVLTKTVDMTTTKVYTAVNQNVDGEPSLWEAESNGGKYISAFSITDIDATLYGMEFCVRPYTTQTNGVRLYGDAKYLYQEERALSGRPQFVIGDPPRAGPRAETVEDTYIRFTSSYQNVNYGASELMEIKDNSVGAAPDETQYSRIGFIKLDISTLPNSELPYFLHLLFRSGTGNEYRVYSVDPDSWDEMTLVANGTKDGVGCRSNENLVGEFSYSTGVVLDVSDIVRTAKNNGETQVSFRIQQVKTDLDDTATTGMYTRESGKGAYIVSGTSAFDYVVNFDQYANYGYEPWGYAEKLVEDWWENIRPIYARDYGDSTYVSAAVSADDYKESIRVTSGSNPPDDNLWSKVGTQKVRTVSSISGYKAREAVLSYDNYGGLASDNGKYYTAAYADSVTGTPGYFGTYYDKTNNRWWFITPEGNRYLALGMCSVTNGSSVAQKALAQLEYGDREWTEWTAELFNTYGLNVTSGNAALSNVDMGYLISTHGGVGLMSSYGTKLGLNASIGGSTKFANNNTMNVFDPDFIAYANMRAKTQIGAASEDSTRIGWTSDNEIPADKDLLDRYLTLDPEDNRNAFSYATAWEWLRFVTGKSNPSIADASTSIVMNMGGTEKAVSLRELFRGFIYYRYYGISSRAVKSAAPNQLYMGCRELGNNYKCEAVMRAAGYFSDVLTVNLYAGMDPEPEIMSNIHKWANKPFYVTEFYAKSAGMNDAGEYVGTQAYGIWEVDYDSLLATAPTANTYYTIDKVETAVASGTVTETYYAGDVALYRVSYQSNSASAGTRTVSIAAYIPKSGTDVSTYYLANGVNTYRDADGSLKTVPEIILTNNRGAGKVVQSQEARGQYYQTFALKMLESGYCVGWSWYRYQDNDVSVYVNENGDIDLYNQWQKDMSGYTEIHSGEDTDQSNLDSNKGIVTNDMKVYEEFANAIGELARNVFSLADYFDSTRR